MATDFPDRYWEPGSRLPFSHLAMVDWATYIPLASSCCESPLSTLKFLIVSAKSMLILRYPIDLVSARHLLETALPC